MRRRWGRAGSCTRRRWWRWASYRARRHAPAAPSRGLSGGARLAALGLAVLVAVIDTSSGELWPGTLESARAHTTVHDGAVYLHQARSYLVQALELDTQRALVEPFSGDFYTQPKKEER